MLGQILDSLLLSVADAWGSTCMMGMFSVVFPLVDPVRRWESAVQGLCELEDILS